MSHCKYFGSIHEFFGSLSVNNMLTDRQGQKRMKVRSIIFLQTEVMAESALSKFKRDILITQVQS